MIICKNLVLWALVVFTGAVSFRCERKRSPNCYCTEDPGGGRYSVTCMKKNDPPTAIFVLSYMPDSYLQIDCNKDEDEPWLPENFEYLKELEFGNVSTLQFRYCPPPETSFVEITRSVGVHKFDKFIYQSWMNIETNFTGSLLNGMNFVSNLKLDSNNFTTLPENLLTDLQNLSSIDLMSNRLNLTKQFFNYSTNLRFIQLGSNDLTEIPEGLFKGLENLKQLNLESNKLESLSDEFKGLKKLHLLDLSNNKLSRIQNNTLAGLHHLQNVSLASNSFVMLPDSLFSDNRDLKKVILSKNRGLKVLPRVFLQRLPELVEVYLDFCAIQSLESDTFRGLKSVQILDLEGNKLQNLSEGIFDDLMGVSVLNLAKNNLVSLSGNIFKTNSQLLSLDLSGNKIEELSDNVFIGLVNLQILKMGENKIHTIGSNAFASTVKLEELYLPRNQFTLLRTDVEDDTIVSFYDYGSNPQSPLRFLLDTLKMLDLSYNNVSLIPYDWRNFLKLEKLDLSHNQITTVEFEDLVIQSSAALEIDLRHNRIETLNFRDAATLDQANQGNKKSKTVVHISNNPFACDCAMYDVLRYINRDNEKHYRRSLDIRNDGAFCSRPPNTEGELLRKVDRNLLVCDYPLCIPGCVCHVRPVDQAVVANCNDANLTSLPTEVPSASGFSKVELHLENNKIQNTEELANASLFENVSVVNLANNDLSFLNLSGLPPKLSVLRLENNKLESISPQSLGVILHAMNHTALNVSLSGNPWKCRCDTRHLMEILPFFQNILDLGQVDCTNLDNHPPLITVSADDFCPNLPASLIAGVSFAIIVLVVLLAALVILYYKNQKVFKAWLYSKGWFLSWVSEEEVDKDKVYDAFISYSNDNDLKSIYGRPHNAKFYYDAENLNLSRNAAFGWPMIILRKDEEFVVRELLPKLENTEPKFKLCLHSRDWPAGEFITDNIYSSVQSSRRTVVLLTKNYLTSSWCLSEFQTAYQYAVEENTRRLILIVVGDLPPLDHLPKDLRTYVTTNTYLRSDDQWFWNKLRYALPHKTEPGKGKRRPNRFDFNLKPRSKKDSLSTVLQLTPTQSPTHLTSTTVKCQVSQGTELEENKNYGMLV